MDYLSVKTKTPQNFKNIHLDKKFLIIGSGASTKELLNYKGKLKSVFDKIISINWAIYDFFEESDYFFAIEKNPKSISEKMKRDRDYRKEVIYFVHWRSVDMFPSDMEKVKMTRIKFDANSNVRDYIKKDGSEGLMVGPKDSVGLSAGTASLQAMHLASIMGAGEIYLMGCDLLFKDSDKDHYYKDNFFYRRSKTKSTNRSPIVDVMMGGVKYKTTEFFRESAKFIDIATKKYFRTFGAEIFDLSGGLLNEPKKISLKDIFK